MILHCSISTGCPSCSCLLRRLDRNEGSMYLNPPNSVRGVAERAERVLSHPSAPGLCPGRLAQSPNQARFNFYMRAMQDGCGKADKGSHEKAVKDTPQQKLACHASLSSRESQVEGLPRNSPQLLASAGPNHQAPSQDGAKLCARLAPGTR